jgi:hypothetical protein
LRGSRPETGLRDGGCREVEAKYVLWTRDPPLQNNGSTLLAEASMVKKLKAGYLDMRGERYLTRQAIKWRLLMMSE